MHILRRNWKKYWMASVTGFTQGIILVVAVDFSLFFFLYIIIPKLHKTEKPSIQRSFAAFSEIVALSHT